MYPEVSKTSSIHCTDMNTSTEEDNGSKNWNRYRKIVNANMYYISCNCKNDKIQSYGVLVKNQNQNHHCHH